MVRVIESHSGLTFLGICLLAFTSCTPKIINPPPANSGIRLTGVVQLAPVKLEKVAAFKLGLDGKLGDAPVASTTSAEDGSFSLVVPEAGFYVIKTEGVGKHLDEAFQSEKDAIELTALVDTSNQTEVPVTPVSTLHQERVVELMVVNGITAAEAMETAATEVAPKFNLDVRDLSQVPVSPYGITALSDLEKFSKARKIKVAEKLAAFSYFIKNFSMDGLSDDEKLGKVMEALRADFKDDGNINGSIADVNLRLVAIKANLTWAAGMDAARGILLAPSSSFDFKNVQNELSEVASTVGEGVEAFNPGATFTGLYLDKYYVDSKLAQLTDGAQEDRYYIDGELAHEFVDNQCYFNGLPEVSNGDGYCSVNGIFYASGSPAHGFYNGTCYSSGTDTGEVSNGDGYCSVDGIFYASGSPANGVFDKTCYSLGQNTSDLDENGNGLCSVDNKLYSNGTLFSGFSGGSFFRGGELASLSTIPATIYLRTSGSDSVGDGTSNNPIASAQLAFEMAYHAAGDRVIDLGEGNFGGVDLNLANANEWPSRIFVQGASVTLSNLGGINASGPGIGGQAEWDSYAIDVVGHAPNGKNLFISGNNQINLGNIFSNGGQIYYGSASGGNGGSITLENVKAEEIIVDGGYGHIDGGSGGLVQLTNSTASLISSMGGNQPWWGGHDGVRGFVSLINSTVTSGIIRGFNGYYNDILYSSGSPFYGVTDNICFNAGVSTNDLLAGTGLCSGDGKFYQSGIPGSDIYQGICYIDGYDTAELENGNGLCSANGLFYQNGFEASGDVNGVNYAVGKRLELDQNGVLVFAQGFHDGRTYLDGIAIRNCVGDCYTGAQTLPIGSIRVGPSGSFLELVYANSLSGFKIWKQLGGIKILNATGLVSNGWQKTLNRSGNQFTTSDFTIAGGIAGRVCPPNVFLTHDDMTATGRCLYHDQGNYLPALNVDSGIEAEDWLAEWDRPETGRGTGSSYYEGNVKVCADKGMRLPTAYETTMNNPGIFLPTGDEGVTPIWAGASGVPYGGGWYAWTASAGTSVSPGYWRWAGSYFGSNNYFPAGTREVRCVLPSH